MRAFQLISATLGVMLFIPLYLAPPIVIADIAVTGLKSEAQKNVRLMLPLSKEKCESPEWKIRGLFDKSDQEINQALRALGYYHPVIKKSPAFNAKCWRAGFTIDSGPQTIVADIAINLIDDARNDPEFQKLRNALLASTGKPLRHDQYEKMKSRLESLALERQTGAGLGVSWYSPIAPVRLDFGLPLNESDSSFQIHFAAGARL